MPTTPGRFDTETIFGSGFQIQSKDSEYQLRAGARQRGDGLGHAVRYPGRLRRGHLQRVPERDHRHQRLQGCHRHAQLQALPAPRGFLAAAPEHRRIGAGKQDNPVTPQVMRTSVAFSGNFDVGRRVLRIQQQRPRVRLPRVLGPAHGLLLPASLARRRVAERFRGLWPLDDEGRRLIRDPDPLNPRGPRSRALPELLRHGRILPHGRDREQPGRGQAQPDRSPPGKFGLGALELAPGSASSISATRSSPGGWPTRTSGPTTSTPSTWGSTGTGRSTSRSRSSGSTPASATPSRMPRICGTRTATRRCAMQFYSYSPIASCPGSHRLCDRAGRHPIALSCSRSTCTRGNHVLGLRHHDPGRDRGRGCCACDAGRGELT